MNPYKKAIHLAMKMLAKKKNSIFLGQQVGVDNFYGTLKGISKSKRMEMPVAEELQLGMSIGMALEGYLPISIYQRMDFLPRACDQIVNHLGLIKQLSNGIYSPKVIIRVTVGSTSPLDTGLQHSKDLTLGFKYLVNFPVVAVKNATEVAMTYAYAFSCKSPIMIIEHQNLYHN